MYEPIRTHSVHTMAGDAADFPRRSREEELDIQLAGHLSALLTVTDEIRALAPDAGLDAAAERLAAQVARLRGEGAASRAAGHADAGSDAGAELRVQIAGLRRRAHALAGRALVVAASRADTGAAILAAECMDMHAADGSAPSESRIATTF
jgi:hypothetical protein